MSRVVHFEIAAREPQKAVDFYSCVLDWKFQKWENPGPDYWLIGTGDNDAPGINGGLASGDPVGAVANTIGVADLDATLAKVEENGGRIVQPRVSRPGMGWYASFEDPVGNQFGLLQPETAELDRPNTVGSESRQQSLPGSSEDRVRHPSDRATAPKTAHRTPKAARQSAARTSQSGTRTARPRSRSSR